MAAIAAICQAYPALRPDEVLEMRIDWVHMLAAGAAALGEHRQRLARRQTADGGGERREADGTTRVRITSPEQLVALVGGKGRF